VGEKALIASKWQRVCKRCAELLVAMQSTDHLSRETLRKLWEPFLERILSSLGKELSVPKFNFRNQVKVQIKIPFRAQISIQRLADYKGLKFDSLLLYYILLGMLKSRHFSPKEEAWLYQVLGL